MAAHFLGGGELRGLTLAGGDAVERPNLRVANVSGAFDNDAMIPAAGSASAFVAAEKVLRHAQLHATARSTTGPRFRSAAARPSASPASTPTCSASTASKLCQITMTGDVGSSHYIEPHMDSGRLVNPLCCFSFPECAACNAAPAATANLDAAAIKSAKVVANEVDEEDDSQILKTLPSNFLNAIDESEQTADEMVDAAA